jgi:cytochrome b561
MKSYTPPQFVAVFHPFVRTLHWLMALIIFVALGLGVWAAELPKGDLRGEVLFVHKSLGVSVLALIVVRVLARLALRSPPYAEALGRLTDAASKAGHLLLYGLMVALPLSGYVMSSAAGREVSFFGLVTLPPLVGPDKALAGQAAETHEALAWAIGIVIALHLAAVVWHAWFKRDTVLTRMWPRFRPSA